MKKYATMTVNGAVIVYAKSKSEAVSKFHERGILVTTKNVYEY